jgi:hypothetical protein
VARGTTTIVHYVPGRLRVKIPQLHGNPQAATSLADQIIELPGVSEVRAASRTGSVVVFFDAEVDDEPSDEVLEALGLDRSSLELPAHATGNEETGLVARPPAAAVSQWFQHINQRVDERTGGVDLRFLVPAVLFALSVRQLGRAPVSPPWYNLLWYAFSTFRSLNAQRLGK